jgi:hypothetical protein
VVKCQKMPPKKKSTFTSKPKSKKNYTKDESKLRPNITAVAKSPIAAAAKKSKAKLKKRRQNARNACRSPTPSETSSPPSSVQRRPTSSPVPRTSSTLPVQLFATAAAAADAAPGASPGRNFLLADEISRRKTGVDVALDELKHDIRTHTHEESGIDLVVGHISDIIEGIYKDDSVRNEVVRSICRCIGVDLSGAVKPVAENGVVPFDPSLVTDKIFSCKANDPTQRTDAQDHRRVPAPVGTFSYKFDFMPI